MIRGQVVSRRLRRAARPIDEPRWNALLTQVADTLDISRDRLPPFATLPALGEPVTAGVMHPTVLMPDVLFSALTTQQLHDVLVHECAHAVRRDPCVGLFQRIAELILWPHPLVHMMNRRLSQAREEVCDDLVLRSADPVGYARTLLVVAEMCHLGRPSSSLVMGLITPRWTLEARVAGLLDARRKPMARVHRGSLVAVTVVLFTRGTGRRGSPAERTRRQ